MRVRHQSPPAANLFFAGLLVAIILSPLPMLPAAAPAQPPPLPPAAQPHATSPAGTRTPPPVTGTQSPSDQAYGIPFFTNTPTRTPTPINIGNFVWDDVDHDGRQDAGEPGLAGVIVQLWNAAKNDLIDQTTTNSNGTYSLIAPTPGDYRVRVLLPNPSLDQFSPKDQGTGGTPDQIDSDINPTGSSFGFTDAFNIASNVISTVIYDAGIIVYRPPTPTRTPTPINIGNFVWYDLNGDGVQNNGETGVPGIVVQLWNEAKNDLLDQTTTNSNGSYTVVAPVPGAYRVRVVLGTGGSFTLKDQGDDQLDSDINPTGLNRGFTDSFTLASNVISTVIYDAGLVSLPFATATPDFFDIFVPQAQR